MAGSLLACSVASEKLPAQAAPLWTAGNCNRDQRLDIADAILALEAIFGDRATHACLPLCDVNVDGIVDISDPINLLNHLFRGTLLVPSAPLRDEFCDGKDNDCDGQTDEACIASRSVVLAWDPVVKDVKGNAERLGGYRIFYGEASRRYTKVLYVGNVTEFRVTDLLSDVLYYFAVVAYDAAQNASEFSGEVAAYGR